MPCTCVVHELCSTEKTGGPLARFLQVLQENGQFTYARILQTCLSDLAGVLHTSCNSWTFFAMI